VELVQGIKTSTIQTVLMDLIGAEVSKEWIKISQMKIMWLLIQIWMPKCREVSQIRTLLVLVREQAMQVEMVGVLQETRGHRPRELKINKVTQKITLIRYKCWTQIKINTTAMSF